MTLNKTKHLMVCVLCLSVAQACAQDGPFDGDWRGRYQTTWGGECGDSDMEISIAGTTVTGTLDVNEMGGRVRLRGTIDTEGRTVFTANISKIDIYRFEGRFRDEQGLILTDPSEAGAGAALKGAWRKYRVENQTELQAGTITSLSGSCAGVWDATLQ